MRRRAQGFTLIEIMVVITIIAALVSTVAIVVPRMQEAQKKGACQGNLGGLAQVYLANKLESPQKAQRYSGVALWLSYRKLGSDMHVKQREEKALVCPADMGIAPFETDEDRKKWDNVDLDNPPDDLCSYTARDFKNYPMNVESPEKEIIGSDRQGHDGKTQQHKNGIIIAFDDGSADFFTREQLGISAESAIVVGPEAENKMLKKVAYVVRKKD